MRILEFEPVLGIPVIQAIKIFYDYVKQNEKNKQSKLRRFSDQ